MQATFRMMTALAGVLLLAGGCATYTSQVENAPGRPSVYQAPDTTGPSAGVGIESQDIVGMCDQMMRDMMANPLLANAARPPHVIVDSAYFRNEGSQRINLNLITDRIRVALIRAANGRMVFVGRHAADMVEKERKLKREGVVGGGTAPAAAKTLGADYRLSGRIADLNQLSNTTGMTTRFTQIIFEMMDLETGAVVWAGEYSFRKSAADDIIYR